MKLKQTVFLATFVVTMGLLLGASAAQAQTIVQLDDDTATGILYLEVGSTLYNVAFRSISADELYGEENPEFDFTDSQSASAAVDAINLALNTDKQARYVGPADDEAFPAYNIGFGVNTEIPDNLRTDVQTASYYEVWINNGALFKDSSSVTIYADFTVAGDPPDQVTIGGTVSSLNGSGLVLLNNFSDELPIDENGAFEFATPLTPEDSYNVIVKTQPTNPTETCVVENGSGTVPDEDVTDVAVTCNLDPQPVEIGGNLTGLVGNMVSLQLNGYGPLTLDSDGPFTFDTALIPGTSYVVKVWANPSNPTQTCSVANGSGQVYFTNVTDVEVSCAEPEMGDLIKIAAEGDILADNTLPVKLDTIQADSGVSINLHGTVAFGGRDGRGTAAVFTQDMLVVREGGTVEDNTSVDDISQYGEVALSAGFSGDRVAFHGQTGHTNAVFTDAGLEVKVGDTLPDETTVHMINPGGSVAINLLNQVAFHGKIQLESGENRVKRAVFTSSGLAAREGTVLDDETLLQSITEFGGVAMDWFGTVAFHGTTDGFKGVFTQEGLVAKEGDRLTDGTTLGSIDLKGGVAINIIGDVAFIGQVRNPVLGIDTVRAVFTQDGPVVKEGDTLTDGTKLDEISNGRVALNDIGEVAFHGRTGSVKGVFTQHGLVAKLGDNLDDNTTLTEITEVGGVAINFLSEVAFHGRTTGENTPNVVVVGLAP